MKRALLVIDVQNEYFSGKMPVTYPAGSLNNIVKAMEGANQKGIPVIIIQHTEPQKDSDIFNKGSQGWEVHETVLKRKYDCLIEKNMSGSFTGTQLEKFLNDHGIDTVVISGYMSQMCCDTTARQAAHLGFTVEFLADATGTLDITNYAGTVKAEDLHRAILVTQAMGFSNVTTTDTWLQTIGNG
jgi:nicotinamidase-related amidase